MISDNILKWYTDEILRDRYNIKGWDLIEKQIKEKKQNWFLKHQIQKYHLNLKI